MFKTHLFRAGCYGKPRLTFAFHDALIYCYLFCYIMCTKPVRHRGLLRLF